MHCILKWNGYSSNRGSKEATKVPADHRTRSQGLLSKCAPAPVSRSATRDRAPGYIVPSPAGARDRRGRGGGRSRMVPIPVPLLIPRAPGPAGGLPAAIAIPAMLACPRWIALGVKFGQVIQQHDVVGIGVAEDMSAVPTMVTTFEQIEGFVAGGRIANGGVSVGLPMISLGETFDRAKGPVRLGRGLCRCGVRTGPPWTLRCRPSTPRSSSVSTVQAVGAAVHTARRGEWRWAVSPFGRPQHGGDI